MGRTQLLCIWISRRRYVERLRGLTGGRQTNNRSASWISHHQLSYQTPPSLRVPVLYNLSLTTSDIVVHARQIIFPSHASIELQVDVPHSSDNSTPHRRRERSVPIRAVCASMFWRHSQTPLSYLMSSTIPSEVIVVHPTLLPHSFSISFPVLRIGSDNRPRATVAAAANWIW